MAAGAGSEPLDFDSSALDDTDDLFASPTKTISRQDPQASLKAALDGTQQIIRDAQGDAQEVRRSVAYETAESRDERLQRELEQVRKVNEVIEGVITGLDKAKGNMEAVSRTITSASTLLNTWIRILSQTEHTQRLLLDPKWQGASQDVADLENESLLKQQAAERRELEERMRQETARRAAEEERQRTENNLNAASAAGSKGLRGRQRGRSVSGSRGSVSGGRSTSGSGYIGVGRQGTSRGSTRAGSVAGRSGSGIGRGIPSSTRARGGTTR